MTLMRLLPRDENGHPRPLWGHRQALRWAAATTARLFFSGRSLGGLGSGLCGASLYRFLTEEDYDPLSFISSLAQVLATLLVLAVFLWLAGTVLLYIYAVLHGGVEKKATVERMRRP